MLGKKVHGIWTENKVGRRLFPKWFEKRDAKRRARLEREKVAELVALYDTTETDSKTEDSDMRFLERLRGLRTSTKSGAVGLVTLLVMGLPLAEEAEAYLQQACENPEGAVPFLIGGGVTWLFMFVTARLSKTPAQPGAV